jgi:hypothetical protein
LTRQRQSTGALGKSVQLALKPLGVGSANFFARVQHCVQTCVQPSTSWSGRQPITEASMTNLFQQLDDEWPSYARSREARLDFAMWSRRDPAIAGFRSPAAILEHVRTHRTGNETLLAAVAERAKTDGTARRLALQIMVPGLAATASRHWRRKNIADIEANLVEFALARLASWNTTRPVTFAAGIVLEARRSLHLRLCVERVEEEVRGDRIDMDVLLELVDSHATVEPVPTVLADAVERCALTKFDADVIVVTRLLGVPINEVAAELGIDYGSLRRRRTRAERVIAPHLVDVA